MLSTIVSSYLLEHWGLLVILVGMMIVLYSDIYLQRRMIFQMRMINLMQFIYSVTCHAETYLGNQPEYSILRPILSAVDYSLITLILVSVIMIMFPQKKGYLFIPALVNALLCFVSIPTGLVFIISKDNHFGRGTLGYLTYVVNAIYLVYLIYCLFKKSRIQNEDYILVIFMSITSVICLVMPLFFYEAASHWFNITIAIDVLLYYIFLLQQFTKRDPLTNLLNRQSYYIDSEKYLNIITAVIAIDMDGLKELNDTYGHLAGDNALKTLAKCFWKVRGYEQRIYRIGGDEYVILCVGDPEEKVKLLIDEIKKEVEKTPYSCSIGYAMRQKDQSIDRLYNIADARMYEEKKLYYERTGKIARR